MNITDKQMHILQHALGLAKTEARPAYRRHYVCDPGHHGWRPTPGSSSAIG